MSGLVFDYGDLDPPLISNLDLTVDRGDRVALIGRNGQGKTTLIRLLAGELSPRAGTIRFHDAVRMAHFAQGRVESLDPDRTMEEEIAAAHPEGSRREVRRICGAMLFGGDDALKEIGVLSGGERSRVQLGKLLVTPTNFLLLDEPTHHLDMESIDALIEAIEDYPGAVMIVSHNELLLERVATRLVVFDGGESKVFEGTYRDFLEQVGWSEEPAVAPGGVEKRVRSPRRKDRRRQRASVIAEQSRVLKPLRKQVEQVELRIISLEEKKSRVEAELCQASSDGESEKIGDLSRSLHEVTGETDRLFEELERLTTELEEQAARFEEELRRLGE